MSLLSILDDVGISKGDIDKAIGASAEIRAGVMAKAKEAQEHWQSLVPGKEPRRGEHQLFKSGSSDAIDHPGDYVKSIRIKYHTKATGFFYATVFTNDPKAAWLEYGTIHNPEFGFAQRTVDDLGGGGHSVSA